MSVNITNVAFAHNKLALGGDLVCRAGGIPNYAFQSCYGILTVSFPNCETIGYGAFEYCCALQTASFAKCESVVASAFRGCSALTQLTFGNCKFMHQEALSGCSALSALYLLGSTLVRLSSLYSNNALFAGTPFITSSYLVDEDGRSAYGSIFVKASLLTEFKTDSMWSAVSSRIVGI